MPGGLLLIWYYSAGRGGLSREMFKLLNYYFRESMTKNCISNI